MQDGQNLFDAALSALGMEWEADEAAERLIRAGRIRPLIIVGIYNNAERAREYSPPLGRQRATGRGETYAQFLVEELKPFIDKEYRTRPERAHTAVGGSSLGGLISVYVCAAHPQRFSACAAISPAIWWTGDLEGLTKDLPKETRYWVQVGTREGPTPQAQRNFVAGARDLAKALAARDLEHKYLEVEGAQHNEAAWAKQFERVLLYLYGK